MKTKNIVDLIDNIFSSTALIMALFGLMLAMIISFTDANLFSQEAINVVILLLLSLLVVQTSKFNESSERKPAHSKGQPLNKRLSELTNSLVQAGNAISAIEREIDSSMNL